ncbi:DUF2931 family protein [Stutzerimonas xanthomarina]
MDSTVMKLLAALASTLFLFGCQIAGPLTAERDPKTPWWSLEFAAPIYMTGWVEASVVEDVQGKLFNHGSAGVIGSGDYGNEREVAKGWPKGLAGSGIRTVVGADLPKRIYVRWQSVVEPQTYHAWIDIPEQARTIMYESTHRQCTEALQRKVSQIASLHLGLAPGGIIQVWVRDQCHEPIKVARRKAEIEPLGPHLGKSGGNYYPQPEASKRYIDRFGIPYGSW